MRVDVMSPNSIVVHVKRIPTMNDEGKMHCAAVRTRFNVINRQRTPSQQCCREGFRKKYSNCAVCIMSCMFPRVRCTAGQGHDSRCDLTKSKRHSPKVVRVLKHLERPWEGSTDVGSIVPAAPKLSKTGPQKAASVCQRP